MPLSIQTLLQQQSRSLAAALQLDDREARIEVQCLLQQTLKVNRAYLLAHPERSLSATEKIHFENSLKRRMAGEPIAYILEEREFFGLNFKVTPATLIPRPETELLVELALSLIPPKTPLSPEDREENEPKIQLLDLGTGSGAIALSLAHVRPDVEITASDFSGEALDVAKRNQQLLGISNVRLVWSDWFAGLEALRFDIIVSNPPYIAKNDRHLQQGDVRFEPITALASGDEGLDDIRTIVENAPRFIRQNGWLLLEHGYDQAFQIRTLFEKQGWENIRSAKDLAGIERCSLAQYRADTKAE